jgi:hypothetical protein
MQQTRFEVDASDPVGVRVLDFLNSVDPDLLEKKALEGAAWGEAKLGALIVEALKGVARGEP